MIIRKILVLLVVIKTVYIFKRNLVEFLLERKAVLKWWDLGVTFDSKLNFNDHVLNTVSKAYKTLDFVMRY